MLLAAILNYKTKFLYLFNLKTGVQLAVVRGLRTSTFAVGLSTWLLATLDIHDLRGNKKITLQTFLPKSPNKRSQNLFLALLFMTAMFILFNR